jgi:predicted alpha/beta hydrolase
MTTHSHERDHPGVLVRDSVAPDSIVVETADGYRIKGFAWRHPEARPADRPVVIVNAATSVRCRYYSRFAAFLFGEGFDVLTYDYRGIGESRPVTLRGFDAGWIDWGSLDFDAMLRYAERTYSGQPIQVVAHSVGGLLIGLSNSNHLIRRVFTVGAQYAYWPDYAAKARLQMLAKWHIAMPAFTLLSGYFPGKKLDWLEDTPKGIVRDWVLSRKRFEDTWRGSAAARYPQKQDLVKRFTNLTAPTLAVHITDDDFGTEPAVRRLLSYFTNSPRTMVKISPESIAEPAIGHFGFFNSRYEQKLWRMPSDWLRFGKMPERWSADVPA